jgi:hypothetical protein
MPRPTASAPLRVRLYFYFACILQRNTTNPASDRPAIRPRPRAPMAGDNTDAVLKRSKRQSPQPSARRAQQAHAACGKLVRRKREAFHRHCAIHCSCACRHVALEMLWHRCLSHCSRQLFARPPPWAAIVGNEDCIAAGSARCRPTRPRTRKSVCLDQARRMSDAPERIFLNRPVRKQNGANIRVLSGRKPSAPFVHLASALRTRAAAPQALAGRTGRAHSRHLRPAIRTREAPEIDAPPILDNCPVDDEASTQYKKCHHDDVNRRLHRLHRNLPILSAKPERKRPAS